MSRNLDEAELSERVAAAAQAWSPGTTVADLAPLSGGASGITYRATLQADGRAPMAVVVKVAPPGLAPVRNRDVLRQARLLRALDGTPGLALAPVLFEDPGDHGMSARSPAAQLDPSDRPPLFVSTFVDGESFEPIIDPRDGPLPPPEIVEGRARNAARMLAALHRVDPSSIPELAGEPVLGLRDELDRWTASFETVEEGLRPGARDLRAALAERFPDEGRPAIVHGDFRLGNLLCEGTEVRAVIDWEIWALTDPRVDLAWFLMFCRRDEQPTALREAPGMPDAVTLRAVYEQAAEIEVADPAWFDAFVRYKQAAAIALIVKHRRRKAVERGEDAGPLSDAPRQLLARGLELLAAATPR